MKETEAEYFLRRAREEEDAAATAVNATAAEAHRKLAEKYGRLAEKEKRQEI